MVNKIIKGLRVDDKFLSFLKRHSAYAETSEDIRKFHNEIEDVGNALFPFPQEVEKYFYIEYSDPVVKDDLTDHFMSQYRGFSISASGFINRERSLFSNYLGLGGFFNETMKLSTIYGKCFYAIDWGKKQIKGRENYLPSCFRYLRASTISVKRNLGGSIVGYVQKYSPFATLPYDLDEPKVRKFDFDKDEIFYTVYPLDPVHPVKKSMKLLKPILRYWDFGLDKIKSSAYPQDKHLRLVKARYEKYSDQMRKYALTRARVRKNFHYILNVNDLKITEYYDVWGVARYKKELNRVRNYFINEFNKQILEPLARKNELVDVPVLRLQGFMTDEEIDNYFQKYKNKEIKFEEFVEKVAKRY